MIVKALIIHFFNLFFQKKSLLKRWTHKEKILGFDQPRFLTIFRHLGHLRGLMFNKILDRETCNFLAVKKASSSMTRFILFRFVFVFFILRSISGVTIKP